MECETQLLRKENEGLKKMLSAHIHKEEDELSPYKRKNSKDVQSECNELRKENLRLQEELLLRSSEVYQLILRTAKVNYRMKLKMQNGEGTKTLRKDLSVKSMSFALLRNIKTKGFTVNYEEKYQDIMQKYNKEKEEREKAEKEIIKMQQIINDQNVTLNKFKREVLEKFCNSNKVNGGEAKKSETEDKGKL